MDNKEYVYSGVVLPGFCMLAVQLVLIPLLIIFMALFQLVPFGLTISASIVLAIAWIIIWVGFFTQQPNCSRVMIFFGKYCGTFVCRRTGSARLEHRHTLSINS